MDKDEWDVLWLYVTSYYYDRCSWSGWLIWWVLWSTKTNCHILFTSFNMQNALVVQWIVALRSLLSFSGGQVDNFCRTSRIQGNEKSLFSRGSLYWQIGMWSPNNVSGNYLYNDVLKLQYTITPVKGLNQVMHSISMFFLMTINGTDCTGTWHYYWQVHNLMHVYMHNIENLTTVGFLWSSVWYIFAKLLKCIKISSMVAYNRTNNKVGWSLGDGGEGRNLR